MPRASRVVSGTVGSPPPFEKRTCPRTRSPLRCAALEIAAADGDAVKVPPHSTPLAWAARGPAAATGPFGWARPVPCVHAVPPVEPVDQPFGEIPLGEIPLLGIRGHAAPYA